MWATTLTALAFSLTVIYIITVSLVVWEPGSLVSTSQGGNVTAAGGNKYEQSTRYETALIGNTLVITVIAVLSSARAMSYVGECIVKVAHHYVEGAHAEGSGGGDYQPLVQAPSRSSLGIRL